MRQICVTLYVMVGLSVCSAADEILNIPEGERCNTTVPVYGFRSSQFPMGRSPLTIDEQIYDREHENDPLGLVEGRCVKMADCPSAILDSSYRNGTQICSFAGKEPVICCTDCAIIPDAINKAAVTVEGLFWKTGGLRRSWDACLKYSSTLPYRCNDQWYTSSTSVFVRKRRCHRVAVALIYVPWLIGEDAEVGEYPHMALLGYGADRDSAQWVCGGTVISERYILTAAHCRADPSLGEARHIALGILRRSDPPSRWRYHNVEEIISHPGYRYPSTYHDIALVRTDGEIQFGTYVLPICIADKEPQELSGTVTGWGAVGYRKPLADQLQRADLSKYNETECSALYRPHKRHLVRGIDHRTQMCYGDRSGNRDTCQGDSGGPLQIRSQDGVTCTDFQIGVTSHGRACGAEHGAGVYTKILPYVPWIEDIVWPRDTGK